MTAQFGVHAYITLCLCILFNLQMSDTLYTLGGDSKAFKAIITAAIVGYPLNVKGTYIFIRIVLVG